MQLGTRILPVTPSNLLKCNAEQCGLLEETTDTRHQLHNSSRSLDGSLYLNTGRILARPCYTRFGGSAMNEKHTSRSKVQGIVGLTHSSISHLELTATIFSFFPRTTVYRLECLAQMNWI